MNHQKIIPLIKWLVWVTGDQLRNCLVGRQMNFLLSLIYENIAFRYYYLPTCCMPWQLPFFVENQSISYLLGLIAFINLILYLTQFVVYTKECVTKSFKSNENILSKNYFQNTVVCTASRSNTSKNLLIQCSFSNI